MTPTLERALHIVGAGTVERKEEGGATIFLSTPEYASIATKLAETYGLSISPTEVASDHVLHMIESASLDGESIEDDDEDDGDDEDVENEDDEEDDGDESEETQDAGLNNLDDDGRALRVLSSAEAHRFAQKIYQGMLGNDNMGGYAAFLQDFDRFLLTHKGKGDIAFGGKKREEASEETVEQRVSANFLELMEKAYADELPWSVPNADDAIVVAAVEIAKKKQKNGRAGLLSALMKAISGDAGDAAVKAWDDKDAEKLNEVLMDAVKKVSGQAGKE